LQTFRSVPKFIFAPGLLSIVAAVGCGTYGGSPNLIHTAGNFSDATLNGSYVYQIHGMASPNGVNLVPYREVGVFTADGNGHITAGTDDSSFGASATSITGTYIVASDGTGSITFNTSSLGIPLNFAITVAGSSQVQLIENDGALNAGGTALLQDSAAVGTTPSGTFIFRLHQEQSAQSSAEEVSQVGAFALSGGAGTGAMDQNLNGTLSSPGLTLAFNAPASPGRGTATLTDTTANFTTDLVYYIVNSGQLALLVNSGGAVGSGSAEAQSGVNSGTGLSGSYAFGSRGDDLATGVDGVATVGQFTATSGSLSGTEDLMQDGNYTASTAFPSTCFAAGSAGGVNGRAVATNGSGSPCSGTITQVFWMVSPNRAFFLDNTGTTFQDGTADLQTVASFTASTLKGQFALTMDGVDLVDGQLLSRVGALQFDGASSVSLSENASGSLSGVILQGLSGSYSAGANGRVVGNLSGSNGPLDLVMYAVSGTQAYVMQQDAGFITSGTAVVQ
jgi:hypothetical protein